MYPGGPFTAGSPGVRPQLVSEPSGPIGQCRCGTKLSLRSPRFQLRGAPRSLEWLFATRLFCSTSCVRAFFLEAMERLDALDAPGSEETISDLHIVYLGVAETFVDILRDGAAPA